MLKFHILGKKCLTIKFVDFELLKIKEENTIQFFLKKLENFDE